MLIPLNKKILVRELESREDRPSGLIVVNNDTLSKVALCMVLAVDGDEDLRPGDHVLATREMMTKTVYGMLVDKKDVLGVIRDD